MVGKHLYYGKIFRGNTITECLELRGVIMGKLSNGRTFIFATGSKVTIR